jgi:hypothetical protein
MSNAHDLTNPWRHTCGRIGRTFMKAKLKIAGKRRKSPFASIDDAVAAIRAGKMIVVSTTRIARTKAI